MSAITTLIWPKKPEPVIVQQPSYISSISGHAYELISTATWGSATLLKTLNGEDKVLKFVRSLLTWKQLDDARVGIYNPNLDHIQGFLGEQNDFLSALGIIERAKEWTELDSNNRLKMLNLLEKKPLEFTSKVFLTLSNVCDNLRWLQAKQVIDLGKIAAKMGEIPVLGTVARLGLGKSKNYFNITSSSFKILSIMDSIYLEAQKTGKGINVSTRDALSLAAEVGKIFLTIIILNSMIFTYYFVASSLFTGVVQMSKILLDASIEEQAEADAMRLAAEQAKEKPGIFTRLVASAV